MLAAYALILCTFAILSVAQQCPDGQYWCGDRCGTYVDTCCQGPDRQDHLCGIETICCGYGCCPNSSYTCNADFSCVGPDGEVLPPVSGPGTLDPDSSGEADAAPGTPGTEADEPETREPSTTGPGEDSFSQGLDPGLPTWDPSQSGTSGVHQTGVIPGSAETTLPGSTNYNPTSAASLDGTATVPPDLDAFPSQLPENSDNVGSGSENTSGDNALSPSPEPSDQPSSPTSDVSQASTEELPVSTTIPERSDDSPQVSTGVTGPAEELPNETLQRSSASGNPQTSPEGTTPEPVPSGEATGESLTSEPTLESSESPLPESTPAPEETQDPGEIGIVPPPLVETGTVTRVTSTITELPSGAWLETLSGDFTEGTVVTTTSSGSDDPTVVPIIVPIGAPPQICWGCIPSFPANIQIKLPDLCVNILGLKVGNCPSGEDTITNGDTKNGGTEEGEGEDKNEDESSTTSCLTTITATHASVFCSVTEDAAARHRMRRQDETGCSTLAYTTVVECETAAGSTTTSFIAQETEVTCSPETCGGSCPVEKRDSHLVKRARPFRPRQPAKNSWPDPSMYDGDTQKFMKTEIAEAYDGRYTQVNIVNTLGAATSNWVEFADKVATLGLRGLFGCTAVVVVSRKGAWMGHFWEKAFSASDVVPVLVRGKGDKFKNEYGLEKLRGNDAVGIGHIFDDENMPRVFIVAPRKKVYIDYPTQDDSEQAGGDVLRDENYVESMKAELGKVFGDGVPVSTVTYMPIAYPPAGDFYDQNYETHRGKVLIQYQPALGDCRPQSMWRVWVEGRDPGENEQDQWTAEGGQVALTKRQEACPDDEGGDASDNGNEDASDDEPAESSAAESGTSDQPSAVESSAAPESSTTTSSSPTAGPTGCSAAEDCPPAVICTGGTVNACEDGMCVCNPPSTGVSTCETTADCEMLECIEGLTPTCWGGDCVCEAPEETPTDDDDEEPTATGSSDAGEPSATCNLHIREYYYAAIYKQYFRVEYALDKGGEEMAADALDEQKWDEEIVVDAADTGLEHPITMVMSKELEPGSDTPHCEEPPPIAPGGVIHRRQSDCLVPQERLHLVKLKYGDLEWDNRPDQDTGKMPHCQVGGWENMGWEGIENRLPNREMDCRFLC